MNQPFGVIAGQAQILAVAIGAAGQVGEVEDTAETACVAGPSPPQLLSRAMVTRDSRGALIRTARMVDPSMDEAGR